VRDGTDSGEAKEMGSATDLEWYERGGTYKSERSKKGTMVREGLEEVGL